MSRPHCTGEDMLPGDGTPRERVHAIIRVDHAGEYGARKAPGYEVLSGAIRAGTRLAIWLSSRV